MTTLAGKRILITGATGALGSRIAHELSALGAHLVLTGRNASALQALGLPGDLLELDLAQPGASEALLAAARENGVIDGIVVAHGLVAFGPVAETPLSVVATLNMVNQLVPIELITLALPDLTAAKDRGSEPFVLTISGIIADMPMASMAAYSASKAGLKAYVQAAQKELRRVGIRVVDARPPHTETGLAQRAISGTAPTMPEGLSPDAVAHRIVAAIVNDERDVPADAFSN